MPALYCIGFAVLWYFLGFWLAVCAAVVLVVLVYKPDLFFSVVGCVILFLVVVAFVEVFF